jgi:hypothetical protein
VRLQGPRGQGCPPPSLGPSSPSEAVGQMSSRLVSILEPFNIKNWSARAIVITCRRSLVAFANFWLQRQPSSNRHNLFKINFRRPRRIIPAGRVPPKGSISKTGGWQHPAARRALLRATPATLRNWLIVSCDSWSSQSLALVRCL